MKIKLKTILPKFLFHSKLSLLKILPDSLLELTDIPTPNSNIQMAAQIWASKGSFVPCLRQSPLRTKDFSANHNSHNAARIAS